MKHKIFSHTSLLIILSVILTFLAAGTVMYNRYDIYMKQGVRDEAAYIKTGLEEDGDVFLSDRVGDATRACLKIKNCTKHLFLSPFYSIIKKKGCSLC